MIFLKLKNILFFSNFLFQLFAFGHIHNAVSALINVVNHDVENGIVVSTLSVVDINLEIHNVDLTWFNAVIFNVMQRCYNIDLKLSDVATSYQPNNNTKKTCKFLLDLECKLKMQEKQLLLSPTLTFIFLIFEQGSQINNENIFLKSCLNTFKGLEIYTIYVYIYICYMCIYIHISYCLHSVKQL